VFWDRAEIFGFSLLSLGILWSLCAVNLFRPASRPPGLAVLSWMAGFAVGELAPWWIALQGALTLGLAVGGALETAPGRVGLLLSIASASAIWIHHRGASSAAPRSLAGLDAAGLPGTAGPAQVPRAPLRPWPSAPKSVERLRGIPFARYGENALLLDVYRRRGAGPSPVLFQIHGGAWIVGSRTNQALPLMHHMAERGWACVSVDYRLSPRATFPEHLIDVKRALRWVRELGPWYGCDPELVVVTGGSAGGHLAALTALTANDPEYQPGFEQVDTRVAGCVAFYGVYDFTDPDHRSLRDLLERRVMKVPLRTDPAAYRRASPIARVHREAPPFLVIQGDSDSLVPAIGARRFVDALRRGSAAPVAYVEVEGAQHAFDLLRSARALGAVEGVERFLSWVRDEHRTGRAPPRGSVELADLR
jgi:acetyl esterase/lipase